MEDTERNARVGEQGRIHLGQVVGGDEHASGATFEVRDPGRPDEVVGVVGEGTAAEANAAVAAAATVAPIWADTAVAERAARITRIADALEEQVEPLSRLVARENGSVLPTLRREVQAAVAFCRYVTQHLDEMLSDRVLRSGDPDEIVRISKRPYGVVACIVPWNAPVILTVQKVIPAIAAGNAVVLKPSPLAPLGVTRLGLLVASHLPAGVVNIVNGGAEVASALIEHPDVRKVSFTGGGATARAILGQAGHRMTPVHLELGGNDPAIVLDDADLPGTVEGIVESAFRRAGQVCFAIKRVYVPRSLSAEFTRLLVERVQQIHVGHALDERATMGPVRTEQQRAVVHALAEGSAALGRDVRVLGTRLASAHADGGYFLLPTVVLDARQEDEVVQVEQFGPILPVVAYDTEDEAVAFANATEFGLCSSVWSESRERATAVAARVHAGVTFVNRHLFSSVGATEIPFGGWKQSGTGWEGARSGIAEYLQFHSLDVHGPLRGSRGRAQ